MDPEMASATPEDDDDDTAEMTTDEIIEACNRFDANIRNLTVQYQIEMYDLHMILVFYEDYVKVLEGHMKPPQLVGYVSEILEMDLEDEEEGAHIDLDSQRKRKCVVLKTSIPKGGCWEEITYEKQTILLPTVGLVDHDKLKPGDMVFLHRERFVILEIYESYLTSGVKECIKVVEDYNDIGGLEKEIQELIEAIVWPITRKHRFEKIGIQTPKGGVLMYGPPGTGKTLVARACAAQIGAAFLPIEATRLVQSCIGDGAKQVSDAFERAKRNSPCIMFIDDIDAIGKKRFHSEDNGDKEVQRIMLELLNQLEDINTDHEIKVVAATNRIDLLDPALLRSGRFDRKVEFSLPSDVARARILQIHSKKMNVHQDVNFEELACSTSDLSGAQLKVVCMEAGIQALRRDDTEVKHEDFVEGIAEVQNKKKNSSYYYA